MNFDLLIEKLTEKRVSIGDIIMTKYTHSDNEISYNYYMCIGIQNCHGTATKQTLLLLNYNEIVSTEYIDIEEDILESFFGYFDAGEEKVICVIPKENLLLSLYTN